MPPINIEITPDAAVGDSCPLLVISGPCVIESEALCMEIAGVLADVAARNPLNLVFKASFDKANRTSIRSFRGPGLTEGLRILKHIKDTYKLPILTDVHEPAHVKALAEDVDILQIPAFLCRQTDLLVAAGRSGRVVNVKKGQFMAPRDMKAAIDKIRSTGNNRILLTERGTTFGYNNLVVDMRSPAIMRSLGVPVIFDATHSVQLPGGQGESSGGQREFVLPLLRAATAAGVDGIFLETHPHPDKALSDGPNAVPLDTIETTIRQAICIHDARIKAEGH